MSFVIDSSVTMTWCFEDEATPQTDHLLRRLTDEGAHVPALWPLEVLNVLMMAERRGRISPTQRHDRQILLRSLPVTVDTETAGQAWTITNQLAERHGITLYDAAYLELAGRLGLPLATLDAELRQAATTSGVPLLPGETDCASIAS